MDETMKRNQFEQLVAMTCDGRWFHSSVGDLEFMHGLELIGSGNFPLKLGPCDAGTLVIELGISRDPFDSLDRDKRLANELLKVDIGNFQKHEVTEWSRALALTEFRYRTDRFSGDYDDLTAIAISRRESLWGMVGAMWASQISNIFGEPAKRSDAEVLRDCVRGERLLCWEQMMCVFPDLRFNNRWTLWHPRDGV